MLWNIEQLQLRANSSLEIELKNQHDTLFLIYCLLQEFVFYSHNGLSWGLKMLGLSSWLCFLNVAPVWIIVVSWHVATGNIVVIQIHCIIIVWCFVLLRLEPSSNQVKRPVYKDSLMTWKDKIPLSMQQKIYSECDMLKELGYPPPPTTPPLPATPLTSWSSNLPFGNGNFYLFT